MKLQILPNWCKKLGLIIFFSIHLINIVTEIREGITLGLNQDCNSPKQEIFKSNSTYFTSAFGETGIHVFQMMSIFGMLIYMLSKEKIEDDYIDKLRLESYQLSSAIWLTVSIIIYGFFADLKISLDYVVFLFMITYLLTFFIKKRVY